MFRFVTGLAVFTCAVLAIEVTYAAGLDPLPQVDTANFLPVIRAQIEQAASEARARPYDAKAAGALAMTLHAYQLYGAAAQSYSRACPSPKIDPTMNQCLSLENNTAALTAG